MISSHQCGIRLDRLLPVFWAVKYRLDYHIKSTGVPFRFSAPFYGFGAVQLQTLCR